MSIQAYEQEIKKLADVPVQLNRIFKSIMQKDVDYGIIPGTPKPSLWKPGAELLSIYFKLRPGDPVILDKIQDLDRPYFSCLIEQRFFSQSGELMGTGIGACNTGETRYSRKKIWQNDYNKMNEDEKKLCFQVRTKEGLEWFRKSTPDEIFTLQNTIFKMGVKRAFKDGIEKITGADRIFSQDLDETEEEEKIDKMKNVTPAKPEEKPNGEKKPVEKGIPIKSGLEGSFS